MLSSCQTLTPLKNTPPSSFPSSVQPAISSPLTKPTDSPTPNASLKPAPAASPAATDTALPASESAAASLITRLELKVSSRFLSGMGDSSQLNVSAYDQQGKAVSLPDQALRYSSSRPQDLRVEAGGRVTALTDWGFSDIQVQLIGSPLSASQLISVSKSLGSGGGGGAAAPPPTPSTPTQESVTGTVTFQFNRVRP